MTAPIIHETVARLCPHCGQPFRTVDAFREHASGYRHDVDASCRARLGKLMCATFTPFGGDKVTGSEFYGTVESCNPCQGAVVMKGAKLDIGCRSLLYGPGHPHLTVSAYRTSVDYQKPESVTVGTARERISGRTDAFIRHLFRSESMLDDDWDADDLPFRPAEEVVRTFICPECGARFPSEDGFRDHLRSCSGRIRLGDIEGTTVIARSNSGRVYGRIVGNDGPRHIGVRGVNVDVADNGDVEIYLGTSACEAASAKVIPESETIRRCCEYAVDRALAILNREVSV